MIALASHYTQRAVQWTAWKAALAIKRAPHQYEDDGTTYSVWFYDGPEVWLCTIWKGTVPESITSSYGQVQNDTDKADFVATYLGDANGRITQGQAPTANVAPVTASVSAVTVLAANVYRVGGLIYNDSNGTLYLKLGTGASSSSWSVKIKGDGYYEVPYFYTGIITGAWSVANGVARVTEVLL